MLGAGLIYWPIFLLSVPFGPELSLGGFSLMPFFVIFIAILLFRPTGLLGQKA